MHTRDIATLVEKAVDTGHETEWIEFKHNNTNPDEVGEYLSALSNSAALHKQPVGYLIWGIEDSSGKIVGTSFKPKQAKVGNQDLASWLSQLLTPHIHFIFHELVIDGQHIVAAEIPRAEHTPVRFKETEFIRVGSYKKKLKDYPEKERTLWRLFESASVEFEKGIAIGGLSPSDVLEMIDYAALYRLTSLSATTSHLGIIDRLAEEKIILPSPNGTEMFDITNLGAILFANDLSKFDRLSRKSVRVILYKGANRIETQREQVGKKGYANGFEGLIGFINAQLPRNEEIGKALRHEVPMYPEIAIRELVANAIIHQDFKIHGTGPMIEIFSDRIEIINPGIPLIEPLRFIDLPPQSRNETLAAFMRRLNICEERGSGIDKVISSAELFQLAAPEFAVTANNHTKAVLFAHRKFAEMTKEDRIRACYQHACLCCVTNKQMTNASLRERFSIADKNYTMASRIISDTIEAGLIKSFDPDNKSRKHARYVPYWY